MRTIHDTATVGKKSKPNAVASPKRNTAIHKTLKRTAMTADKASEPDNSATCARTGMTGNTVGIGSGRTGTAAATRRRGDTGGGTP